MNGVRISVLGIILATLPVEAQKPVSAVWSPDNGDGTYTNPVLNADYSDPDVTRVGDKFYLVASSFDQVPGLPILESYDLVNWHLIGHALERQPPFERYAVNQHGNGVWAPAIRFHDGQFYIFYPDPDIGIYMTRAKNAAGPWSTPLLIKAAKGWIDPCPLWDEDGKAYLVNALAASRAGAKTVAIVSRMKPDGTELLDGGTLVYDGHKDDPTFEGPKFYKRHGFYYIFAPAGGVTGGWQVVLRSRNVFGPYERRRVLEQGTTAINGPHQGAWVDTGTGEDWFLHFQDRGWLGRIVHLEPMKWVDDWPVMGERVNGVSQPVARHRKPHTLHAGVAETPADSDEFNAPTLGLQWQWQANPEATWGFPSQALGVLRLIDVPAPAGARNLWETPAVLLAKAPGPSFIVTVKLNAAFRNEGDRAGLTMLGMDYGAIEIVKTKVGMVVRELLCARADKGSAEVAQAETAIAGTEIYLRIEEREGETSFSYSGDGTQFIPLGKRFTANKGVWIGAKVGLFATGEMRTGEFGYADFDWIRFARLP